MIDIQTGISKVLEPRKHLYPCHVNRISSLDDPCLRKLYYMRHNWDKAILNDDYKQGLFETGKAIEPIVQKIVIDVGMQSNPPFRIIGTQLPTNDNLLKQYQISGTIDGILQIFNTDNHSDHWLSIGVVDIKGFDQNVYKVLNVLEDLNRYSWSRKYKGQLMLYALADNFEQCFILAVNKANLYDMKFIEFPIDLDYCESLLNKAKTINEALEIEEPPKGNNDPELCPKCSFYAHCNPPLQSKGNLTISDNTELESILDKMAELKDLADEYENLKEQRDQFLIQGQDLVVGNWMVLWKKIEKIFKQQPIKEGFSRTEWRKTITKIMTNI